MLYTAAEMARVPTLLAFRDVMPTRILCVYGMPLTPVRSIYRTHGLADTGIATSPMKNGSIQMLLVAATSERCLTFSESQPVKMMLMVNRTYPGMASRLDSNTL